MKIIFWKLKSDVLAAPTKGRGHFICLQVEGPSSVIFHNDNVLSRKNGIPSEILGTYAKQETTRGHCIKVTPGRCQKGAEQTDPRRPQRNLRGAEAINEYAADQHQENVGNAIDRIQHAQLGVGKTQLLLQCIGKRAHRIVNVVIAKHQHADECQDPPAGLARCRGFCINVHRLKPLLLVFDTISRTRPGMQPVGP